jgi:hypothetical protein
MSAVVWLLAPIASADDNQQPVAAATDFLKVEIQGTLTVQEKVQTDLKTIRSDYYKPTGAFIRSGDTFIELYVNEDFLKTAREFSGRRVVLTGTLVVIEPPLELRRLTSIPLISRTLVQVNGIKAANVK